MLVDAAYERECREWLAGQIEAMTEALERVLPSDFNESTRYLPSSVSPLPGFMSFKVNPFMREIVDCFAIDSPIREVNLRKGVQITYTTVLESVMLYYMAHIKTAPLMYVTADKELATARVENNIIPMINQSGLSDIIQSSDEDNPRKTGKTANHIQWIGGGYMVPQGANNAAKMRQYSIMVMLKDELDAWPDRVGKDGDPDKLTDDRCAAYWPRRKIFRGSTPLEKGSSKIDRAFERGDQRHYYVHCLKCGYPQQIVWRGKDEKTGKRYGMVWETDGGVLVPESVRWCCANCGHGHQEHDKVKLLDDVNHGAHWKPHAKPAEPGIRSYHLPALYSPNGMQPWAKSVAAWIEAWDDEANRAKSVEALKVFYNNVLAQSFEVKGDRVRFVNVSGHRRQDYQFGTVPNQLAVAATGNPIQMLICTVDVHKSNLAVAVHGWTPGQQAFLIDYWRLEGDCEQLDTPATWGRLSEIIETQVYTADDGKKYNIALTLIDAGYNNDLVLSFCSQYANGVFPILGRDTPSKNQTIKEFAPFTTQIGTIGYRLTVDLYKDRWGPRLNRTWNGTGVQREGTYNAPVDTTDKQLMELTREVKREKVDKVSGRILGHEWHRPGNAPQELWDLLVYANAGLDLIAWDLCRNRLGLDHVNWQAFWDVVQSEKMFYTED